MRVITWNVNSIRTRKDRLLALLSRHEPDVVCLQELKCEAPQFPLAEVEQAGYHAALWGQKTYNGVAILARQPPQDIHIGFAEPTGSQPPPEGEGANPQARILSARVGQVDVICVYVPNGSELGSDKYAYKLRWLAALEHHVKTTWAPDAPVILCGDFNIAPEDRDVAALDTFSEGIFCSPEVRGTVQRLAEWGMVDLFRRFQEGAGLYSWWDYRQLSFPKNRGLRIDLMLASEPLASRCRDCFIDRDERKGKQPSDHAPVVADFDR